ncbi:MAG: universal stress protein [Sphingomonadales bacterium]
MSIRTILVPLTGGETCERAAEAAARVAKAFDGHLFGMHVRSDAAASVPYVADGLTADLVHELVTSAEREGDRRKTRAREIFDSMCETFALDTSTPAGDADKPTAHWEGRTGAIGEVIAREARIMDLTVVPQPDIELDPITAGLMDEVMTRSGRAVLMAPKTLPEHVSERVMIAWNGSTEAARAVADAMPFLLKAKEIFVLTVGEMTRGRPGGNALAKTLTCHGLKPVVLAEDCGPSGVDDTILDLAKEHGITLLVVGAYSHSRWRELVLGGVTRTVIEKATMPVLMSH